MSRPEKVQAALRLMGDPYASLSLFPEEEESFATEPTFEQKRAYFKKLEDPHAFSEIFGDSDDNLWLAATRRKKNDVFANLEKELDGVLNQYKRYVAQNEWERLIEFRPIFLRESSDTSEHALQVANRLQKFKFSLDLDEKVECNRAKAGPIIKELKKILG
jgi:hypothetical protein